MQAFSPEFDPMPGHAGRVVAKDRLPGVISLLEAYAAPVAQIDRRPDFHELATPAQYLATPPKPVV